MTDISLENVFDDVYDWIFELINPDMNEDYENAIPIVRLDEDDPRPDGLYVGYRLISPIPLEDDYYTKPDNNDISVNVETYDITVQIVFFRRGTTEGSKHPLSRASDFERLTSSLRSQQFLYDECCFIVVQTLNMTDVPTLLETSIEPRAQVDILIRSALNREEDFSVYPNYIEHVSGAGEVSNPDGDTIDTDFDSDDASD
jgi:hypothetical protein